MTFKLYTDSNGIPYSEYGQYSGIDIGKQRSFLSVAERGLWYLQTYNIVQESYDFIFSYNWKKWPANKDNDPIDHSTAYRMSENCANWLLNNLSERNNFLVWVHEYDFKYNTHPGWCSSHTQAVGMQFLIRMSELSNNPSYIDPFPKLLTAFSIPVESGGLCIPLEKGGLWYEKIADADNDRPMILNGMLFALIGLFDIAGRTTIEKDLRNRAQNLANRGVTAATNLLHRFDLKDWSSYTIQGKRASKRYHQIHIEQLDLLYRITNNEKFSYWRDCFTNYLKNFQNNNEVCQEMKIIELKRTGVCT